MRNLIQVIKNRYKKILLIGIAIIVATSIPSLASASPDFSDYPISSGYVNPKQMVSSGDSVWYLNKTDTVSARPTLSRMSTAGVITDFDLLPSTATALVDSYFNLTVDSSGNVWFVGCGSNLSVSSKGTVLGYIDPTTNAKTIFEYAQDYSGCGNASWALTGIAIDSGGTVWVSQTKVGYHGSNLKKFSSTGTYLGSVASSYVQDRWVSMTAGPNDTLWLTDADFGNPAPDHRIYKLTVDPITKSITSQTRYILSNSGTPKAITAGLDGNVWFINDNTISKITPSGNVTEYIVLTGTPNSLTVGPDGVMWFTSNTGSSGYIGRVATNGTVTQYEIPGGDIGVRGIAAGSDNALWFTEEKTDRIGRISADPFFSDYALPSDYKKPNEMISSGNSLWYLNQLTSNNLPTLSRITSAGSIMNYSLYPIGTNMLVGHTFKITKDSSDNIWFIGCAGLGSSTQGAILGYVNPATDAVTYYQIAKNYTGCGNASWALTGIAIDSGGTIWVSETKGGYHMSNIRKYNSSGSYLGSVAPAYYQNRWTSLVAGPNDTLWLADTDSGNPAPDHWIHKLTIDPSTQLITNQTRYLVPNRSQPQRLTVGVDGNIWFVLDGKKIGKMTPSGTVTEYSVPFATPYSITAGADGAMWFTSNISTNGYIGRITSDGLITQYEIPGGDVDVRGIAVGSDEALWFAEEKVGKIGRLGH